MAKKIENDKELENKLALEQEEDFEEEDFEDGEDSEELENLEDEEDEEESEDNEEGEEPEEEFKLPSFADLTSDEEEEEEEEPEEGEEVERNNSKSLIGMLVKKKYSQLKKDIEEIVASKVAAKIQDKKEEFKKTGFRSVGVVQEPDESEEPDNTGEEENDE